MDLFDLSSVSGVTVVIWMSLYFFVVSFRGPIDANKDSWEKVWTAFEELKKIEKIKIRFITVIHEDNYDEIIPLMKLIQSKKVDFHSVILLRGTTLDPHIKLPSIEKLNKLAVEMFDILEKYNYGQKSISAHILKNYHRYLWKTSLETIKKNPNSSLSSWSKPYGYLGRWKYFIV